MGGIVSEEFVGNIIFEWPRAHFLVQSKMVSSIANTNRLFYLHTVNDINHF